MFQTLKVEMVRQNKTMVDLSKDTGIRYQTLSEKLRGNSPITLKDAALIKKALHSEMSIDELFELTEGETE